MSAFYTQEFLHSDSIPGDCFRACIASIIGLPMREVPHFALLDYSPEIRVAMQCAKAWLSERGYDLWMNIDQNENPLPLCIVSGVSPRGIKHAVFGDTATGEIVHDPHPSRAGLQTIEYRLYLFKKEYAVIHARTEKGAA